MKCLDREISRCQRKILIHYVSIMSCNRSKDPNPKFVYQCKEMKITEKQFFLWNDQTHILISDGEESPHSKVSWIHVMFHIKNVMFVFHLVKTSQLSNATQWDELIGAQTECLKLHRQNLQRLNAEVRLMNDSIFSISREKTNDIANLIC